MNPDWLGASVWACNGCPFETGALDDARQHVRECGSTHIVLERPPGRWIYAEWDARRRCYTGRALVEPVPRREPRTA